MINSRKEVRKYFFPVYWVWALVSPTIITLTNAILHADIHNASLFQAIGLIFQQIPYKRVPSYYALFGLIYPLTFVVYPAFFISFTHSGGDSVTIGLVSGIQNFFKALTQVFDPIQGPQSRAIVLAVIFFLIAWLGPVIHLIIAFRRHKRYIEELENQKIKLSDYLLGFI